MHIKQGSKHRIFVYTNAVMQQIKDDQQQAVEN